MFIVVLFPAPFGPNKPTISPSFIVKLISSTATTFPYFLVIFFTSITKVSSLLFYILDKYIKQYYYHKDKLKDYEFTSWPDLIIEQRFLTILIESSGCTHKPIIDNYYISPEANQRALDLGFTHLGTNKTPHLKWVVEMLEENDKQLYTKVLMQIKINKK